MGSRVRDGEALLIFENNSNFSQTNQIYPFVSWYLCVYLCAEKQLCLVLQWESTPTPRQRFSLELGVIPRNSSDFYIFSPPGAAGFNRVLSHRERRKPISDDIAYFWAHTSSLSFLRCKSPRIVYWDFSRRAEVVAERSNNRANQRWRIALNAFRVCAGAFQRENSG